MLEAGAVDILQADATRCLGVTGFLQADALAVANALPLSSHCGPSIHAHLAAAVTKLAHLEYFRDHARLEHMLFDGVLEPAAGELTWNPRAAGSRSDAAGSRGSSVRGIASSSSASAAASTSAT